MTFHIITIFPQLIEAYLEFGIVSRAAKEGLISVQAKNLRDYALNQYGQIDDGIFGHGKGMLFRPEPLHQAISDLKKDFPDSRVVFLTPQGRKFDNTVAKEFAAEKNIIMISARYEGIDSRIVTEMVDDEISVGDYVLTGGELPALVVLDATARFVEGSIKSDSANDESFEAGLLEYDHYTQPLEFRGVKVPEVLRSGDRAKIDDYRLASGLKKTYFNRPELLMEHMPRISRGETRNGLKAIRRENDSWKRYLNTIEKIAKEWKDVRRK